MREELHSWYERTAGRETLPGIKTSFDRFDRNTGGLHRGDLMVLAARPGMGKTSFVTGCVANVAKRGESAVVFSLEMPARQLAARMICTEAGLSLIKTRSEVLEGWELTSATEAVNRLGKLNIVVDDAQKARPTVFDIATRTRRHAAKLARAGKRLGLLVVDYIQIVRVREVLLKQRHELAIGEVSTELKALAKELDIAVVAVAQLNRGVESRPDKRPGLNDLRDSGQLEQDADIVTFLYRDEYYNPETSEPGIVEVIVEKQRNGPTGTLKMKFDGPTTRFENLPDDGEDGRYA